MNLDERLRLSNCLDDYKLQEVVVVATSTPDSKSSSFQQAKITAGHSVQDLPTMSGNGKAPVTSSASSNMSSSATGKSKTALKSMASESALHHHAGHDKKKRGLLGFFHFGKNKKGSVRYLVGPKRIIWPALSSKVIERGI